MCSFTLHENWVSSFYSHIGVGIHVQLEGRPNVVVFYIYMAETGRVIILAFGWGAWPPMPMIVETNVHCLIQNLYLLRM